MKGFLGGTFQERTAWISSELRWMRMSGQTPLVLFPSPQSVEGTYRDAYPVLAPGYARCATLDILLEFALAQHLPDDGVEIGRAVAEAIVPDSDVRDVRDPFWHYSARLLIEAMVRATMSEWTFRYNDYRDRRMAMPSLTRLFTEMVRDVQQCRFSSGRNDPPQLPSWWGNLDDEVQAALSFTVFNNAAPTAGSIFSEVNAYISNALSRAESISRQPFLRGLGTPAFVYGPAFPKNSLLLLLRAAEYNIRPAVVVILELGQWKSAHHKALQGFIETAGEETSILWTAAESPGLPWVNSPEMMWGNTSSGGALTAFADRVRKTAGNDSGLLTGLRRENPHQLEPWETICYEDGQWKYRDIAGLRETLTEDPPPALEPASAAGGGNGLVRLVRDVMLNATSSNPEHPVSLPFPILDNDEGTADMTFDFDGGPENMPPPGRKG